MIEIEHIKIKYVELETFLFCSLRYALPRSTYITSDIAIIVEKYFHFLDNANQRKIIYEIKEGLAGKLGMEIDQTIWKDLLLGLLKHRDPSHPKKYVRKKVPLRSEED